MKIKSLIKNIASQISSFYENDYSVAYNTAWLILEHVTGKTKEQLFIEKDYFLNLDQKKLFDYEEKIKEIISLLIDHKMPLQYILGTVNFLNLDLNIKPPILIPRPETEDWCNKLLLHIQEKQKKIFNKDKVTDFSTLKILDLCTGSGCIALALAKNLKNSKVFAIDNSQEALDLAKENAIKNGIKNCEFIFSDLFKIFENSQGIYKNIKFDFIVSNPPYISSEKFKTLDPSVTKWEDPKALLAEDQGLEILKRIISISPQFLNKNGELWCEIDCDQGEKVISLFKNSGYKYINSYKDINNRERVVQGII